MITEEIRNAAEGVNKKSLFTWLENEVMSSGLPEEEKSIFLKKLFSLKETEVNVLIAGATGSGKSSTINALFGRNVAKVGTSVFPETLEIEIHRLENLVIWDTPGFGDGIHNDNEHAQIIRNKLNEEDKDGNALIDLVLVIVDGSSRDLGTTYEMINKVIIPALGEDNCDRLLVAINQADMALKGRYWNAENCEPEEELIRFLEEKAASVKQRIYEETGVLTEPVCYSAGYTDENGVQSKPYNIVKLIHYIVEKTSEEKKAVMTDNLLHGMWAENEDVFDEDDIDEEFEDANIIDAFERGYSFGEKILGIPGGVVAGLVTSTVKLLKNIIGVVLE